ncbi:50S ribosomal protein L21 [bacterium]|nr:50S ribosomal protein L21 [bacterium]
MYAIVEIGGSQWKVEQKKVIRVPSMEAENGKKVTFSEVLLVVDNKNVEIGTPYVKDAVVEATVLGQGRDKKVLVFKKKRRKNYKVLKGHRQGFTELKIDSISVGGKKSSQAAPEQKAAKPASEKAEAKKAPAAKTVAKPAAKKSAAKTGAAKPAAGKTGSGKTAKPAAKKTAAKPAAKAPAKDADKKKE